MYRLSQRCVPSYIQNMFNCDTNRPSYLRSANELNYLVPRPKSELYKGSMSYSGAKVWNSIPNNIKQSQSIKSFSFNYVKWINSN